MSSVHSIKEEYTKISRYHEGARYCKIDLHTHTPASECSSFSLPDNIEKQFPKRTASKTSIRRGLQFLRDLDGGKNPFKAAYDSKTLRSWPRLGKRPALNQSVIRKIARVWLEEIRCVCPADNFDKTDEQTNLVNECLNRAFADLRRYLKSLFFPEEFLIRCYLERLELVALADHNHPGYIVPRLPTLGTWHSLISDANSPYDRDIENEKEPGGKVRDIILKRLKLAEKHLSQAGKTKVKHRTARLKRVAEKVAYWKDKNHKPSKLRILPGTEITVSDVHLLALFPPEWYAPGRIAAILRAIGIPESQWGRASLAAATSSVQDTITFVDEAEGLVIPAHCNSDHKGLLRLFTGGLALNRALEHPALLALEIVEGTVKKGKNTWRTLRWLDTEPWRPNRAKPITFVKGSDAHECRIDFDTRAGKDLGDRCTYIKADIRLDDTPEEVFRSLRMALLCGQSRVIEWPVEDGYDYYASDKNKARIKKEGRARLLESKASHRTILGITAEGRGSYMGGLCLRFNPYLNCVVGTGGKSAIVRLVGYGFGVLPFMKSTPVKWLPSVVRVFWTEQGNIYCIERRGKSVDPNDENVEVTWFKRSSDGRWKKIAAKGDAKDLLETWPRSDSGKMTEDEVIAELQCELTGRAASEAKPLLVMQPRNIFKSDRIFKAVLSKPHFKTRQIIWSTRSANIPVSLDAEKIIITKEKDDGKHVEIACAGDLHQDEIREQFLNHMEGGWQSFLRREALYSL